MPNWQEIAVEVERIRANAEHSRENALSSIRREYLRKFHDVSGRNVIAYYSGFLSKRDADGLEINHEDTNAFMVTIHQLDRSRGLDLVLHTPGGGVSAAISIVSYLRAMFGRDIRVIVLSAHHCFMHAFMNGPAIKIVENHRGTAVVKQLAPYARSA